MRLAERIKQESKCLSPGSPSIYRLPLQKVHTGLKDFEKYVFGKENKRGNRTIMVIGATGSGKSTLINGMINYILGVKWEDEFRFKLIHEDESKSQAESQTSLVTAYEINYQDGVEISNSVTIIDTPGFGDTRGIKRDIQITEQIRKFFTSKEGISDIDAVCFVTQASQPRLTHAQRYVFDSVLSIFGKDIAKNIQMLVTFADGQRPPVLEAINVSGVPCPKRKDGLPIHFKFNNSVLFADNGIADSATSSEGEDDDDCDESFDKMFWSMCTKNMNNFFVALTKMETKSLTLTKEVLQERKQLETAVEGLQKQVQAILINVEQLKMTQQILQDHEAEINRNKNFTIETEVMKPIQKSISQTGHYITNYQKCFFTCHYPCNIPNDDGKSGCAAMGKDGHCRACPGKCHWSVHFNQKYRWEYQTVKEKITSADLKEKYEKAYGAKMSVQQIIKKQEQEIVMLQDEGVKLMEKSSKCLARLQEIALKPNPLSTPEYINLLIESEKSEAKPGYMNRIKSLEAMKERALLIAKVSRKEALLPDKTKAYK